MNHNRHSKVENTWDNLVRGPQERFLKQTPHSLSLMSLPRCIHLVGRCELTMSAASIVEVSWHCDFFSPGKVLANSMVSEDTPRPFLAVPVRRLFLLPWDECWLRHSPGLVSPLCHSSMDRPTKRFTPP